MLDSLASAALNLPSQPGAQLGAQLPVAAGALGAAFTGNVTSAFNLTAIRLHNRPAFFLAQTVINATLSPASPLYPFATDVISAASPFLDGILRQYLQNDFFAGSLWLVALGILGRFITTYSQLLWSLLARRGNVSVSISPGNQAFQWVQEWLESHKKLKPSEFSLKLEWDDEDDETNIGPNKPELKFLPKLTAAQQITFQEAKVFFQMRNSPGQVDSGAGFSEVVRSMKREELVIEAPCKAVLQAVLQAATDAAMAKRQSEQVTAIQRWNCKQFCWRWCGAKHIRPISSVVLDCDTSALLEDARQFLASAKWYADRGIPHRRGYLFHGPPGCGKTSLIQAMAGHLGLDVATISLSSSGMSDDSLHAAMGGCEQSDMVVLEDIDAAFTAHRTKADSSCSDSLSFSGLLNAIDGIAAQERRILIMTTNHIDRLDPALIRPGRIDYRLLLDLASCRQIARLFLRFFPSAREKDAERFSMLFQERVVSPASVQGFLLLHKDDPAAAIAAAPAFAQESCAAASAADAAPHDSLSAAASAADSPSPAAAGPAASEAAPLPAAADAAAGTAASVIFDNGSEGGSNKGGDLSRELSEPCAESSLSSHSGPSVGSSERVNHDCCVGEEGGEKGWIAVAEASEGGSEEGRVGSEMQRHRGRGKLVGGTSWLRLPVTGASWSRVTGLTRKRADGGC